MKRWQRIIAKGNPLISSSMLSMMLVNHISSKTLIQADKKLRKQRRLKKRRKVKPFNQIMVVWCIIKLGLI